ncbi:T26F17.17 [Cucumis melo var. makuwa]|uniref:T26F17.17 n=1 Tax=Cucumis melo var. makuwa TaxID=1194695 RepID=A0A5D3D552_CUCMM|nr:T26F17.17 [Cucumis melo var. makuwa]
MTEQLFQSKLKLKDKEDSPEKGNRGRGRGGNRGRGDFKDRGRGSYGQRKFDESNSNSNSSRGRGRQHYSRLSGERSNNDRRNRVEENANYAKNDEESGDSSLFLACKRAETCENSAWYLDSGASNHMCGSKSMFVELDESVGDDIVFGDATKIPVKGKDPNWIWHLRFGHLNFDGLRLLARKNMVKGLPYVKHPDQLCEGCLHGKQSRKSFPQESSSRARRPLELVRTNLCGPIKPSSLRFKTLVEKESGYYIKALRSDRGGEFTSNEFKTFCAENGIRRPTIVSFTPQQNDVIERKNRIILNMAQSMLKCKKMPKEFWAQAVECAVYLSNRSPTRSLWNKTPQQAWIGRRNMFLLAMMQAQKAASSKGYKLYNPVTKKTIVTGDVVFDEEASWNWNDEPEDYKFLFFPDDRDEPSDIASPPTSPITPQQSTSSSSASSSEVPRGMRSLRDIYDETEELSESFSHLTLFCLFGDSEPLNFEEASQNDKWKIAMDEEIKAIKKNDTWELSTLPNGKKAVGNCASIFEDLKDAMKQEFEMTDIRIMSYYLGIEVKQSEEGIFIFQERYTREILEKFNMMNYKPVATPIETGTKLSKHEEGDDVDPSYFKSLVGSLRYLTCTRPDILFSVGLVSRFMEYPTTTHLKVAKRIRRYIRGTLDYGLFYSSSKEFKLESYCDSEWAGDTNDRKSTSGYVFFIGNTAFTWSSKKQPIVIHL